MDDRQGRGLGTALPALSPSAPGGGSPPRTARGSPRTVSCPNRRRRLDTAGWRTRAAGTIEVAVTLPQQGFGEHLHDLLRSSAAGSRSPLSRRRGGRDVSAREDHRLEGVVRDGGGHVAEQG